MLPHYSALKVAESFSMLSGLYPGRIDLGIGRAPGTDPMTMFALQRDRREAAPDDFPQQLAELLGYLDDSLPATPFRRYADPPRPARDARSAGRLLAAERDWAAELSLPYSFADFINREGRPDRRRLPRQGGRTRRCRSASGSYARTPTTRPRRSPPAAP